MVTVVVSCYPRADLILTNLKLCDVNPLAVDVVVVNVPASSGDSLEINLGSRFSRDITRRG